VLEQISLLDLRDALEADLMDRLGNA
jgi:hypothetical protein